MKPFVRLMLLLLFLSSPFLLKAQIVDQEVHRVVFQVTKGEAVDQEQAIGQLNNILRALPNAEIEVICHGKALPLLLKDESKVTDGVTDLLTRGVVFAACENTMRRAKATKEDLISGVITVPSALAEIIIKQEQGWAYIKAGN
ncbi:DsrE family protein [Cyclobacterium jeungdonense]|uniref:DsrE family protein n=1 Tax=Cyclobacterium jeungdonense TaxID=708087 RepID=A0ABT8CD77_9BACT|nr:DsrE family protein [Cyclobacterium jeungdonense]MDN3690142.1 DsrE family protein [Cyclobacterium jeungdonense]